MMTLIRFAAAAVILWLFAVPAGANLPGQEEAVSKLEAFSLVPPVNWVVNIEDANDRGMYAYIHMDGYTFETTPALMYIRLMDKMGVGVDEHLKADMEASRKQEANLSIHPFKIGKLQYAYAARKYLYGKKSCDYLCYVDPGKDDPSYLIFVLTTDYKHCDSYTEDFKSVLKSFHWRGKTDQ